MHSLIGKKAALQFSGGKDSMACLYLLRELVEDGLPVYWMDTGDCLPSTRALIEQVRAWVPNFHVVHSDVRAWRDAHGMPSDVVTSHATVAGRRYGMGALALVDRFDCCAANRWLPMHERMLADGIDVVIRGTKTCDSGAVPAVGATPVYEVMLPLMDWTHDQVFAFLQEHGAPMNTVYSTPGAQFLPECAGCTALWTEGKARLFKHAMPERVPAYKLGLQTIREELARRVQELDAELKECE